jgi:hypothetical protein
MKAMYKILTVAIVTLTIAGPARAQTADLVLGARPQGLGGAFTAVADDANAVYWNPAGLGRLENGEITFMHWMFSDISQVTVDHAAFAQPLGSGAIGLSWTRQGAELEQGLEREKSTMAVNTFLVSFGLPVGERVSLGVTLNRTLVTSNAPTNGEVAFDGGLLVKPLLDEPWTVGITAKNVGGEQVLPPYYAVGTAYRFEWPNRHLLLSVDAHSQEDIRGTEDFSVKYGAGLEFGQRFDDFGLALRGGINSRTFAAGLGLGWRMLAVDYAFVIMREDTIGDSHKVAITYVFGR